MTISAIVAVDKNNAIGKDNEMPWYLPEDLKYFKKMTLNHHVIMGRNSYKSIGRPLPKRTNIVLTRDPYWVATGVLVAHSIEEALSLAYDNGEQEAFIIGGGKIYEQTVDIWDKLYLTEVDISVQDADTFFPEIDMNRWKVTTQKAHEKDEKNQYAYTFKLLERK